MINKIIKQNYNSVIKLLLMSIVFNFIVVVSMVIQNVMFYKANFAQVNVTQTVNINTGREEKININTGSKRALESLPGIGENKADSIIENRPYSDIYELRDIVGEVSFGKLKNMIET